MTFSQFAHRLLIKRRGNSKSWRDRGPTIFSENAIVNIKKCYKRGISLCNEDNI